MSWRYFMHAAIRNVISIKAMEQQFEPIYQLLFDTLIPNLSFKIMKKKYLD
jgi:hypothetical protein